MFYYSEFFTCRTPSERYTKVRVIDDITRGRDLDSFFICALLLTESRLKTPFEITPKMTDLDEPSLDLGFEVEEGSSEEEEEENSDDDLGEIGEMVTEHAEAEIQQQLQQPLAYQHEPALREQQLGGGGDGDGPVADKILRLLAHVTCKCKQGYAAWNYVQLMPQLDDHQRSITSIPPCY